MVFENDLCSAAQSRADCRKLYEHVRTVLTVFHHFLYVFKMAYGSCKAVQNSFGLRMNMAVTVFMASFMNMIFHTVAVYDAVAVIVVVDIVFVQIITASPEISAHKNNTITVFRQVQYAADYDLGAFS